MCSLLKLWRYFSFRLCPGSHQAASSLQPLGETLSSSCAPWRPQHVPPAATHTHAHTLHTHFTHNTLTHMNRTLQITRRTYQRLHKYLATPLFTRQKRCTARNECECVYVTERWAGGVRFGCLNNNLGKVAAAASLLLRGKIWNPPSSSCLPLAVDEAMDSLLCGIIFLFFFFLPQLFVFTYF